MCCAVAGVYLKVYFLGGQTAENEDEAISIFHALQLVFISWVGEPEHKYAILPILHQCNWLPTYTLTIWQNKQFRK